MRDLFIRSFIILIALAVYPQAPADLSDIQKKYESYYEASNIQMEILLKNDGMQNWPKSQTWDFIKRSIPGNLGGMGMVSAVILYLFWYC